MSENKEKLNDKLSNYIYENKIKPTEDILEIIKTERKDTFLKVINNNLHYTYQYYPNIISNDICDFIINESEKYAENNKSQENPTGWTKSRHKNYPTTDLPILLQNLTNSYSPSLVFLSKIFLVFINVINETNSSL